jgi:hypothetical protein
MPRTFGMMGGGSGTGQQQARGPQPVATQVGDLPAGAGQQIVGGLRRQHGADRLPRVGDLGLEPGAGLGARRRHRHADRQRAAVDGHLAERPQDSLEDPLLQVDGHALEEEQRRAVDVQARAEEQAGHRGVGEVGGHEPDVPGLQAEPGDALELVRLGGGVVDLEPAHAALGVAERAAVVPGAADDDLPDPAVERVHHHPVEERRPRPQVLVHPGAGRTLEAVGDVTGQGLVRGRVAVRGLDPRVIQPVRGHAACGARRRAFSHVSLPGVTSPDS